MGVMPKEVITAEDYGKTYESLDGKQGKTAEWRQLEVRWSRNKYVEVATVTNNEPSMDDRVQGTFLTLDRNGLNRAIRALRKARDQAFGRDE